MNTLLFHALMLLVVLSPLPIGSNRPWSWSLCAVVIAGLTALWAMFHIGGRGNVIRLPSALPVGLFALTCAWAIVQMATSVPDDWQHPLWPMVADALGTSVPGTISLSADDTATALMRLLAYALAFLLTFQLTRDRARAQAAFAWMALAGLAYALFALYTYWSGYEPEWLFRGRTLQHDARGTFVNRNHFVTWQGLTILCAIAWFYQRMARPALKPYAVPQDRESQAVEFLMRAWTPLLALVLMITALVLTHSRGGFAAALGATIALLALIDRRASTYGVSGGRSLSRATVVAALLVTGIAFYLTSEAVLDRIQRTDLSTEERTALFADVVRGIDDNPVLGYGYGTFADSFLLYDRDETPVRFDRAHNTWLENAFELGVPAALALYAALIGFVVICWRGVTRRHRDWVYPATGVAASVLVGLHALVDFSLQLPAIAMLYACIMGVAVAQSTSTAAMPQDLLPEITRVPPASTRERRTG